MTDLRHVTALDRHRTSNAPTTAHIQPPAWTIDAVCASVDPDVWYPEKGGTTNPAKRICAACPVRRECLGYALDNDERFGIWGGKSERERRRLKKQQAAA